VVIGIKAGWRHEEIGKRGITHFLEHTVFLGNKSHPTPDNEVAKYGITIDGMTLPEYTLFFFTSTKENFAEILNIFLSLIFHPDFDETKLEREKQDNIITAITQESDYTPWELAEEWAKNLVFNWQFLTSLGTEQDIKSLMKEDLVIRHRKYYHAGNSFIIIYGDTQENEVAKLIKDANIPSSGEIPSPLYVQYDKKEIFIKKEGMKNVETVYGFKLPRYAPEWEILRIILGNYPISKLWEEKFSKFTYTLDSKLKWTTTGGGFFLYFGVTSPDNVLKINRNLWNLLKDLKINEEELELAKKIRTLEILKMKEEGEQGLLKFVTCNPSLMYKDFKEMVKKINQVKREKVLSLIKEFLTRENAVRVRIGTNR